MPNMVLGRRMSHTPWPIEELVRAQCMACDGASYDAIAQALGRPVHEVRRKLDPEPAVKPTEFADVDHAHLKGRQVGSRTRRGPR